MQKKVCFNFFIFCAILSQGILAEFLEKDVEESSNHLFRQKRVIDRRPGREMKVTVGDLPYVANLKQGTFMHCIATILSRHTAITAARCVTRNSLQEYTLYSGAAYSQYGDAHNLTDRKMHGHDPSRTPSFLTGIALITVNPPFVYSRTTGSIGLHSEPVLAGMESIIPGWGVRIGTGPLETRHVKTLRVIGVQIMNHRECQNIYRGHFPITEEDVCTYHPEKLCANNDDGAPLIIDNQLAGVHIGGIFTREECPIKPDVFVLLQHTNYRSWIMNNIEH